MKQEDIIQLSIKDLREKIQEEKQALTKLQLNHAVAPAENPLKIRSTRRTIARLNTELRAKQIAEQKKDVAAQAK